MRSARRPLFRLIDSGFGAWRVCASGAYPSQAGAQAQAQAQTRAQARAQTQTQARAQTQAQAHTLSGTRALFWKAPARGAAARPNSHAGRPRPGPARQANGPAASGRRLLEGRADTMARHRARPPNERQQQHADDDERLIRVGAGAESIDEQPAARSKIINRCIIWARTC